MHNESCLNVKVRNYFTVYRGNCISERVTIMVQQHCTCDTFGAPPPWPDGQESDGNGRPVPAAGVWRRSWRSSVAVRGDAYRGAAQSVIKAATAAPQTATRRVVSSPVPHVLMLHHAFIVHQTRRHGDGRAQGSGLNLLTRHFRPSNTCNGPGAALCAAKGKKARESRQSGVRKRVDPKGP